ncbi:hypothetical protein N781_16520 [Pontibacillus halophilus JSM 076056 = DSM 19796]|uniref:Uncharacterized protein n=1 Tax=Pontibacillus halophilus JSM 076056 = DSM 19796 TaxID=1385510 RepID=A0A0A5I942_9BACI|nr:hypothetical protein N781_16520 [Pontibacillus halophilus JSM 076056 = DSM 19796]
MVKNLPLLIAMQMIGCSTLVIASQMNSPQLLKSFLLIASTVLNVWSMIGLILHVGIQNVSNKEL